mmetsp:Transcript_31927/g.42572  ORF Transcript_31927/g.42572 Transcript_31927/m.42572 type:complete len:221 (-) Transcript_31927:546-1208(-)
MSGQQNETQVGASGAADKSPEENKKGLGRFIQWGLITVGIVGGIAINGASIGIAAAGRLTNMAYVVVAAGAFTAGITGPLNLYNEYILKKNNTMRDHINAIRNEVNRLAIENNKLHNLINELENDVGRLKDIEEALSTLAKAQGASIEKLLFLVQENKRINRETKVTPRSPSMLACSYMYYLLFDSRKHWIRLRSHLLFIAPFPFPSIYRKYFLHRDYKT